MAEIRLGLEGRLYIDILGVGVGSWDEVTNVKDLTLSQEVGEADVTTRANNGHRAIVATLIDGSLEWEMVLDKDDPGFNAIKDAFYKKNSIGKNFIGLAVMDGDITTPGTEGLIANCAIMNFSRNEALEEAMTFSVSAKPTFSDIAPDYVTIQAP